MRRLKIGRRKRLDGHRLNSRRNTNPRYFHAFSSLSYQFPFAIVYTSQYLLLAYRVFYRT